MYLSMTTAHPIWHPWVPLVAADMSQLTLRPFRTSHTFRNLQRRSQGVFHTTDDVELLARAGHPSDRGFPPHLSRTGGGRRCPRRCLPLVRPASAARRTNVTIAPRCTARSSPTGACETFSVSIGRSMPWSKRPSWRHALPTWILASFSSSSSSCGSWSRKPAALKSSAVPSCLKLSARNARDRCNR